ncbi:Glycosyltransferase, GT2 family [Microbulbifer donghaiensis]|uniref:Glycosyltransferase, GT2 family n=1 Tax=Microbulbifer donghaiensis TaxID=494016 RepID=A0A1M5CKJ2_9GAMM|nr:glycosyltransferase [Microbulbifer donghaiensis]SHF55229.1 Glycosyltransferase, GT2 family [Microbulbifer donghaiensis]
MGKLTQLLFADKSESITEPRDGIPHVWVDVCGILGQRYLLIQGWAFHPAYESVNFRLVSMVGDAGDNEKAAANSVLYTLRTTRLDVNKQFGFQGAVRRWGYSLLLECPEGVEIDHTQLRLSVEAGRDRKLAELKPFEPLAGGALFGHCATWNAEEKQKLFNLLRTVMGSKVYEIEGFPHMQEGQLRAHVNWHWDNVLAVPGRGVFLAGWLLDGQKELASMVLRSSDGCYSSELLDRSVRYARQDVLDAFPGTAPADYKAGLYAWIPMPHLMERSALEIVMLTKQGAVTILPLQQRIVREDITLASQQILVNFNVRARDYQKVMREHVGPALAALWENRQSLLGEPEVEVVQFGAPIEAPKRSVIVPLYGRYDFLLHQVAQFTSDKDFAETELIYVLDDPRLYEAFMPFCHDTAALFPVSFKVVYAGRNLGYAGANNLGARYATSDQLVLLNSDIIPSEGGWLSRIEHKATDLESVGVVAPKLVYDDGTIQHLGMSFSRSAEYGQLWLNEHPGKGKPEWLVSPETVEEAPAVTGACMFISKALYESVGGLDETYVLGDFEDSDLCLKLRKAGYRHYVLGDEKLYHLERQSQNLFENHDWKFKITLYNAWQHTERWGALIEELVA